MVMAFLGGGGGSVVVETDGITVVCVFLVCVVWCMVDGVEEVARAEKGKVGDQPHCRWGRRASRQPPREYFH
jgi:hypothetical protein